MKINDKYFLNEFLKLMIWITIVHASRKSYSFHNMPNTKFTCQDKILGGYYADPEAECQMFHICVKVAAVGVKDFRFLCPNGTAFNQDAQICANWDDVECDLATIYYGSRNFDIYRLGFMDKKNSLEKDHDVKYLLQKTDKTESDIFEISETSNYFSQRNNENVGYKPQTKQGNTRGNIKRNRNEKLSYSKGNMQIRQAKPQVNVVTKVPQPFISEKPSERQNIHADRATTASYNYFDFRQNKPGEKNIIDHQVETKLNIESTTVPRPLISEKSSQRQKIHADRATTASYNYFDFLQNKTDEKNRIDHQTETKLNIDSTKVPQPFIPEKPSERQKIHADRATTASYNYFDFRQNKPGEEHRINHQAGTQFNIDSAKVPLPFISEKPSQRQKIQVNRTTTALYNYFDVLENKPIKKNSYHETNSSFIPQNKIEDTWLTNTKNEDIQMFGNLKKNTSHITYSSNDLKNLNDKNPGNFQNSGKEYSEIQSRDHHQTELIFDSNKFLNPIYITQRPDAEQLSNTHKIALKHKQFSTLAPRDQYYPTTFKPTTYKTSIKKLSQFENIKNKIPVNDENNGQYHPELYEKQFLRSNDKLETQNNFKGRTYDEVNKKNSNNTEEDEVLKVESSINIAAARVQQRILENKKTSKLGSTTVKARIEAPIENKRNEDSSYDYAYYDSFNSSPQEEYEYDVISEFSKTKKKHYKL